MVKPDLSATVILTALLHSTTVVVADDDVIIIGHEYFYVFIANLSDWARVTTRSHLLMTNAPIKQNLMHQQYNTTRRLRNFSLYWNV